MVKLLLSLFFSFILVGLAGAQPDSTQFKTAALRNPYQQVLKKYEAFEALHGHYLKTPNVTMHYLSWGKPTGRPLVWVHGTGSNGYEIARIADSLAKKGYYILAIDYYGHGRTPIPTQEVSIYHVADDIAYLLNQLHIKKTLIGGWSRGGGIATAFYGAYPDRVIGVVLEDGGSVCPVRASDKMGRAETEKQMINAYKETVIIDPLFATRFDAFAHYQVKGQLDLTTFHAISQTVTGDWGLNPGLWHWLEEDSVQAAIRNSFNLTQGPLFEQSFLFLEPKLVYRRVQVPVLIYDPIDSTNVFMDLTEDNRRLCEQHPQWITHLVYPDTGHAVKFQRFDRFYTDLRKFLAQVEAPKK